MFNCDVNHRNFDVVHFRRENHFSHDSILLSVHFSWKRIRGNLNNRCKGNLTEKKRWKQNGKQFDNLLCWNGACFNSNFDLFLQISFTLVFMSFVFLRGSAPKFISGVDLQRYFPTLSSHVHLHNGEIQKTYM